MENKTQVYIYTSEWCNFCHSEMDWLTKLGISFEEKSIEDEKTQNELKDRLGGELPGTPITVIGEDVISGFDRPKIIAALEKYGLKQS